MSEKRTSPRWVTCLKGQVRVSGNSTACLIRDFSAEGARIELPEGAVLPDDFDFYFPLKQATFRARVRWRRDNELGLSFEAADGEHPIDPVQAQLLQTVRRLEAENAELRLECTQLRTELGRGRARASNR